MRKPTLLDDARQQRGLERHEVADAVLVLDEHEDARDHVLEEALRAETDQGDDERRARGRGEQAAEEEADQHEGRDRDYEVAERARDDRDRGLTPALAREVESADRRGRPAFDHPAEQALDDERNPDHQSHNQEAIRPLRQRADHGSESRGLM